MGATGSRPERDPAERGGADRTQSGIRNTVTETLVNLPPPQRAYMSRRPRGRCRFSAEGAQVYNKGISSLHKWYSSTSCYRACPGAARPGARALPRPLRRGLEAPERAASQVEPDCCGQNASLHCPQRTFNMDLVRLGVAYLMAPVYPGCWIAVLPY